MAKAHYLPTGQLGFLVTSRIMCKLLAYLSVNTDRAFRVRDLEAQVSENGNIIRRYLKRLKKIGFVTETWQGTRLYYATNPACPIIEEIRAIATTYKEVS